MKIVEEISTNINSNNINGVFSIDKEKIFYKILSKQDYKKEKEGYEIFSKFYKVPKRYFYINKEKTKIIGYEYNNEVTKNNGLLVDYFSTYNYLDEKYYKIMEKYSNVFKETLEYNYYDNCKVFFDDRVNTRLKNNIKILLNMKLKEKYLLNYENINIDVNNLYNDIKDFFVSKNKKWNVIAQADPNDLNICIDGTIFDYTGAGKVPLMAEFATFFWYNLGQAEYLALKYNKQAFINHENIYMKINEVVLNKEQIKHKYRLIRINAIIYYLENVIAPLLSNVEYKEWYLDFKNFLAMKVLAVFDFNKMEKKDIIYSISYIQLLYNKAFKEIDEFIVYIKDWRKKYDLFR